MNGKQGFRPDRHHVDGSTARRVAQSGENREARQSYDVGVFPGMRGNQGGGASPCCRWKAGLQADPVVTTAVVGDAGLAIREMRDDVIYRAEVGSPGGISPPGSHRIPA